MAIRLCSLASGSSGNATYVATERTSVLVDCGASAREIVARLEAIGADPAGLDGILISHAHGDHYRAAGTLHCRYGVPIYVDPSTARSLAGRGHWCSWRRLTRTWPIPRQIGDLEVHAIDTHHGDPQIDGRTVAYVLSRGSARVGVVTDLGRPTPALVGALRGAQAILLEANHDEGLIRGKLADRAYARDWHYLAWVLGDRGHLSNLQCAGLLSQVVTHPGQTVLLGHMSENHLDPRRDNNDYRLALRTVGSVLSHAGLPRPRLLPTFRIGARPSRPSEVVEV